jgi:hypothetical protein
VVSFDGIGRRLPVVVITRRKRQAEAERNAFEPGRDAERYFPRREVAS